MALTEQLNPADYIGVTVNGSLEIREATVILRDDVEIARSHHRYVLAPGDDLTGKDPRIVAIANTTWTLEVIAAFKDAQAKAQAVA